MKTFKVTKIAYVIASDIFNNNLFPTGKLLLAFMIDILCLDFRCSFSWGKTGYYNGVKSYFNFLN